MYQNNKKELENIIKKLQTIEKWEEDYALYKECEKVFYNYNRNKSIELIQKIIQKYASQINTWGFFCDNVKICYITYDDKSDKYIVDMLAYLGQRIPVYVLIRESEEKLIEKALSQITKGGYIF